MKNKTIIRLENVCKTYVMGEVEVKAVCGVNLEIKHGEFVSIMGPSGSGKSTAMNMVGCLDTPTEGKVLIDGVDVSTLKDNQLADIRRSVGFVFQFFNLIPRLSALGNVELPLSVAGLGKSEKRKRAEELLDSVGLTDRMNHKPAELSGGQRQRVAIARALANSPSFLLMDEPTGNIDSKTANEILSLIKQLNVEKGVTIIMITHDQQLASQAKKIMKMLDGTIIKEVEQ